MSGTVHSRPYRSGVDALRSRDAVARRGSSRPRRRAAPRRRRRAPPHEDVEAEVGDDASTRAAKAGSALASSGTKTATSTAAASTARAIRRATPSRRAANFPSPAGPRNRPQGFERDGEHVVEHGVDGPFPDVRERPGEDGGQHAEDEQPPGRPDGPHAQQREGERGPPGVPPGEGARLPLPRPPVGDHDGTDHGHPGEQPPDTRPVDGQQERTDHPGDPGSGKDGGRQRDNRGLGRRQRPHQHRRRGHGHPAPPPPHPPRHGPGRPCHAPPPRAPRPRARPLPRPARHRPPGHPPDRLPPAASPAEHPYPRPADRTCPPTSSPTLVRIRPPPPPPSPPPPPPPQMTPRHPAFTLPIRDPPPAPPLPPSGNLMDGPFAHRAAPDPTLPRRQRHPDPATRPPRRWCRRADRPPSGRWPGPARFRRRRRARRG